jgi:hypothetical protein
MKAYALYLGDGRYYDFNTPGCWAFHRVLTTSKRKAKRMYRRYKNNPNRYNPGGWPNVSLERYEFLSS